MNKELASLIEEWLSDPELEGEDAKATLSTLVSQLPVEMSNSVEFSLKGFIALIKGENK